VVDSLLDMPGELCAAGPVCAKPAELVRARVVEIKMIESFMCAVLLGEKARTTMVVS